MCILNRMHMRFFWREKETRNRANTRERKKGQWVNISRMEESKKRSEASISGLEESKKAT